VYWVVLVVNPFDRQPAGSPDLGGISAKAARRCTGLYVQIVSDSQFRQYSTHPYALTIGKVLANGNDIRVDENYIPPCYSVSAHPDLVTLHGEWTDSWVTSSSVVRRSFKRSSEKPAE
jgi:hypothetical protein